MRTCSLQRSLGRMKYGLHFLLKGGSRPFTFENMFLSSGWGDVLDMYPQLEGGFGSMHAILPMRGLGAKNGSKTENLKEWDRALKLLTPFDSSPPADKFSVVGCQNWIKMAELCPFKVGAKVASWPILTENWLFWPYFLRHRLQICFAQHLILRGAESNGVKG